MPSRTWIFLAVLVLLACANLFIRPAHPHFEAETAFGFWPMFGLIGGLVLAVAGGAVLAPLTRLPEDDNER